MQSAVWIMDVFHFYHTDPHQVSFPENAIANEDTQSHRDRNHVRSIGWERTVCVQGIMPMVTPIPPEEKKEWVITRVSKESEYRNPERKEEKKKKQD